MAPRTTDIKKAKGDPDGAPPGAEARAPGDRYAFNADDRAKAREAAAVTIGETVFHRRRKNWKVTRDMRSLLRDQERSAQKAGRLTARVDAANTEIRGIQNLETGEWIREPVTDDAKLDELEQKVDQLNSQIDAANDEADEAAYKLIAALLRTEDGDSPDVGHLQEHLDATDAGDLAAMLAGGGEPDPTTEPTSS